jgi:hypothetical protein
MASWIVTASPPVETKGSRFRRALVDKDSELVHRVLQGAERLSALIDRSLATSFLSHFLHPTPELSGPHPNSGFLKIQQRAAETFRSGIRHIPDYSDYMGLTDHRLSILSTPSWDPTLGSSNSSSTLSSMRRLAVKYSGRRRIMSLSDSSSMGEPATIEELSDSMSFLSVNIDAA